MKSIQHIFLFILFTLNTIAVSAQTNDYAQQWKKIDAYNKKGLSQDGQREVEKIFNDAARHQNHAQLIKASMHLMKYRNKLAEDSREGNIYFVDSLIAKTKAPAKNILLSMKAELLQSYKDQNRWKLYDRTALVQEQDTDIQTWSIQKLLATTSDLYKQSLQNTSLLKQTKIDAFEAILNKGKNTRNLRPTLYDFLAHRALAFFMNQENDVLQPANRFILNDEKIFAPVSQFITAKFVTADTASQYYNALLLLQQLLKHHQQTGNSEALLDANLIRLQFANDHGIFTHKEALYLAALQDIENNFSNSDYAGTAMVMRAQVYINRARTFHPITDTVHRMDAVQARDLLQQVVKKYPESVAAINSKNMLQTLQQPHISLLTEKVNIPDEPFRSLLTYKNVPAIYLRVVKINRQTLRDMEMSGQDAMWSQLIKMDALKAWSVALPATNDLQQHKVEIKVDALPAGTYLLLASIQKDFSLHNNIIARQLIYCSNISYLHNNEKELYLLHRKTGMPLAGGTIQLWEQTYDYAQRKYIYTKKEKFTSDKNGLARIALADNRYNSNLQIIYQGDELFTNDNYSSYAYNSYQKESTQKTFLFTDRSIYRPGQTIFFKGIIVQTDADGRSSKLLPGYKTHISLYNANSEKVESIAVTANDYGSFSGSFKAPEGMLNGSYSIKDDANYGAAYFNVEEYKRPQFFVEINKPGGSYRLNDSIRVTGIAKAYAGNVLDGATVAYRVVRKIQYPIWCGWGRSYWPPIGSNEQMEITNGTATTNAGGEFEISFKAIPDESADKANQPIFYYEVMADVTDINGETRSAQTELAVSYQALELSIASPEKILADSISQIKITSQNRNGLFEQAQVELSMYKLQQNEKLFRSRYWEQPDQFVMTKEEYQRLFPHDVYADENEIGKWPLSEKIFTQKDTTTASGKFAIASRTLSAGWYKLIATTTDKYGESVKAEKYIYILPKDLGTQEPILFTLQKETAAPGHKVEYSLRTAFDKLWIIQTVNRMAEPLQTQYSELRSNKPLAHSLTIAEADRGGIGIDYVFVKNNRVYSGTQNLQVPWSNKELQISFSTFRDKLLPGATEEWSMKISGSKGEKLAAEMLLSMYDASLDQFAPHQWASLKTLWPHNNRMLYWTHQNFGILQSREIDKYSYNYLPLPPMRYDALKQGGWNEGNYMYQVRNALMGRASGVVLEMSEEMDAAAAPAPAPDAEELKAEGLSRSKKAKAEETNLLYDSVGIALSAGDNKKADAPAPGGDIQLRKNFNETAFFFPQLHTDSNGNLSFKFTMPEALTRWKLMALGHNTQLASGYSEQMVVTQKPLMVQPNLPRFLREGDDVELVAKIVNLSDKEITGIARLELIDAVTGKPVDGWFKNVFPTQYFTVEAGKSAALKFPFGAPHNFNSALTYRITAQSKDAGFSDGEESTLPVLSNRILVTESLPLNMRKQATQAFRFDKLLQSAGSNSISHQSITVEYTGNPAWYAVQALPYLMEYPYECAEQNFNRYYANTLAGFVANSTPKIKAVFEKWKATDTAALLSNLQKNQELKSALLQETPWVLQAKSEAEQKQNIALLFDLQRLAREKQSSFKKLKEMQSSNGGFTWFKGGPDDRFITQYIVTGIGHLQKLNALSDADKEQLGSITDAALPYLDNRLYDEYRELLRQKVKLTDNQLSSYAIQYLYMRSFFAEQPVSKRNAEAVNYYKAQAKKYWLSQSGYMQAMIGLALYRMDDAKTAKAITASLQQNAIRHPELGMYWKAFTTGGYYWYQAPVESQALMIELFSDVEKNTEIVDELKTWLLKQKQVQSWKTTKATAEAVYALLLQGSNWLAEEKKVSIQLGSTVIDSESAGAQAGTGYFKQTIEGAKVQPQMGNITVSVTPAKAANSSSSSWGAVYWQYFEELDNITSAATPLRLKKEIFAEQASASGPVLRKIAEGDALTVGNKVKVRIELRVDRDMEYVHLKDMRAAGMEPVNVLSQYKWQGGLGYYESTRDASTTFSFSYLPRGTYVFEYALFVNQAGNFSNGIATIQSMYAPEFSSHSEGIRLRVENK